jgi:hypothetical protein
MGLCVICEHLLGSSGLRFTFISGQVMKLSSKILESYSSILSSSLAHSFAAAERDGHTSTHTWPLLILSQKSILLLLPSLAAA